MSALGNDPKNEGSGARSPSASSGSPSSGASSDGSPSGSSAASRNLPAAASSQPSNARSALASAKSSGAPMSAAPSPSDSESTSSRDLPAAASTQISNARSPPASAKASGALSAKSYVQSSAQSPPAVESKPAMEAANLAGAASVASSIAPSEVSSESSISHPRRLIRLGRIAGLMKWVHPSTKAQRVDATDVFGGCSEAQHLAAELFQIIDTRECGTLNQGQVLKAAEVVIEIIPFVTDVPFDHRLFREQVGAIEECDHTRWMGVLDIIYDMLSDAEFTELMVRLSYALRHAFWGPTNLKSIDTIASNIFRAHADKKSGTSVSKGRFPTLLFAAGIQASPTRMNEMWNEANVKWGDMGFLDKKQFKVLMRKYYRPIEKCERVAQMYASLRALGFKKCLITPDSLQSIMLDKGRRKLTDAEWSRFRQVFKGDAKKGISISQFIDASLADAFTPSSNGR